VADRWHTVPDLAEQLGVSRHKVLAWIASGELSALNVAAATTSRPRWRISQDALDRFLSARQSRPPAVSPPPKPPRPTKSYV